MGARFTEHVCMQRAPRRPRAQVDAKTCKGTCGKTKAIADFYTDQCVCKDCVHVERKLLRRASAQGEEDYVKKLKREEPKEFSKLCQAFGKAVKPGQKAQSFCVASWKRHVGVRSGQRSSLKRKWMWEREYVEFQGTTAQGSGKDLCRIRASSPPAKPRVQKSGKHLRSNPIFGEGDMPQ